MRIIILVSTIVFLMTRIAFAGFIEDANAAIDNHKYFKALELVEKAAKEGNPRAQYVMGDLYSPVTLDVNKRNVFPVDYDLSFEWHLKAAKQGVVKSQYIVGTMYKTTMVSVGPNEKEAQKWLAKAADQGHARSQSIMAVEYKYDDVEKQKSALRWFKSLANEGHERYQYHYADMLLSGLGTKVNRKEAITWFFESAKRGDIGSIYRVASIYEKGAKFEEGAKVQKYIEGAVYWYKKLANTTREDFGGHPIWISLIDELGADELGRKQSGENDMEFVMAGYNRIKEIRFKWMVLEKRLEEMRKKNIE